MELQQYGWKNGEYHCKCGTMIGKNLLGESPFLLVKQHIKNCQSYKLGDCFVLEDQLEDFHKEPQVF